MEIGRDLLKFLRQYNKEHPSKPGVGLAANQLGINASVFVILQPQLVFINPKMVAHSHAIVRSTEGCLSLPGITVQVNRYIWIEMSADNWKQNRVFGVDLSRVTGKPYEMAISECTCVQHEFDHTQGVLILDR
jgi:peptide deformylase